MTTPLRPQGREREEGEELKCWSLARTEAHVDTPPPEFVTMHMLHAHQSCPLLASRQGKHYTPSYTCVAIITTTHFQVLLCLSLISTILMYLYPVSHGTGHSCSS